MADETYPRVDRPSAAQDGGRSGVARAEDRPAAVAMPHEIDRQAGNAAYAARRGSSPRLSTAPPLTEPELLQRRERKMAKAKKPPKPTIYQSQVLAQIAQSPLMKTYSADHKVKWGLANGKEISEACAAALIRNGWVRPERDGFFEESQTYTALTP